MTEQSGPETSYEKSNSGTHCHYIRHHMSGMASQIIQIHSIHLTVFFRVTSLARGQSCNDIMHSQRYRIQCQIGRSGFQTVVFVYWIQAHLQVVTIGRHFAVGNFLINLLNKNNFILIEISTISVPKSPISNNATLLQVNILYQVGEEALTSGMMTQSTNAYVRYDA